MTAKEYLSQGFVLDRAIKSKKGQILRNRDMLENVSTVLSKDKVQTSRNHDKLGDLLAKSIDLEKTNYQKSIRK